MRVVDIAKGLQQPPTPKTNWIESLCHTNTVPHYGCVWIEPWQAARRPGSDPSLATEIGCLGMLAWARQHCPTPNQTRPTPNKQAHADCQSMRHIQPMCTQTNGALACSAHTAITAQRFRPYSLQLSFFSFLFTSYIHHCTLYTLNLTNIIHHDHPQILVLGQTYNAVLGH